jgi:hypothetical protein
LPRNSTGEKNIRSQDAGLASRQKLLLARPVSRSAQEVTTSFGKGTGKPGAKSNSGLSAKRNCLERLRSRPIRLFESCQVSTGQLKMKGKEGEQRVTGGRPVSAESRYLRRVA